MDRPASDAALDACAQEPIHIPGSIQPHGALLVLAPADLRVLQASTNCAALLGVDFRPNDGCTLPQLPGLATLGAELARWRDSEESSCMLAWELGERRLKVLGHRSTQGLIVEFEAATTERAQIDALYPQLRDFVGHIELLNDTIELCRIAARELRRLTGFNRVLIYRFDAEWHGEVLAEDRDEVLPSYLGLHFPAADIPEQARRLYAQNRLRLIVDADYQPVPVEPPLSPVDGRPLDLSFAVLRSVSPVHLEYMRNMGTGASMSISILVDGRLWGLASCHNREPKRVGAQLRAACNLIGQILSLQIGAVEARAHATQRLALKQVEARLLPELASAATLAEGLLADAGSWLGLVNAHGAAVLGADGVRCVGLTPSRSEIEALAAWLNQDGGTDPLFHCDSLAARYPPAEAYADVASGVIAMSISQLHPSFLLWFRREVRRVVDWAGDPRKPQAEPNQILYPRASFAQWRQEQRLRAEPWTVAELEAATDFRAAILNFVLRRAEERAALTEELERSNRELESFSYSVSHDLRAPFRHIVGYAELLRQKEVEQLDAKARHYLDNITDSALSAGRLVDDLLAFAHLGRTAMSFSRVDVRKLVDEVRRSLLNDLQGRHVEWKVGPLPETRGDASLLRQVFINLIGNAVKYSRGRDPAIIEIGGEEKNGEVVYSVRDNGVGFDVAYAPKLFGVFQRLHRIEEFEGTGIGLALCRRIVERHGGWIAGEGVVDQGATFQFGVPIRGTDNNKGLT